MRWSARIERALDLDLTGTSDRSDAGPNSPKSGRDGSGTPAHDPPLASKAASGPSNSAYSAMGRGAGRYVGEPASPTDKVFAAAAGSPIAMGRIDRASLLAAVIGGAAYLALASLSLLLSHAGDTVSPIWLPNACAVAFLLRSRLKNELPFLLAAMVGSLASNAVAQLPNHLAAMFSLGNVAEIVVVVALTRTSARLQPDMSRLSDLARFVWAGGLVGPLVSALLTASVMGADLADMRSGAISWFLTDSMAMVLVVPTLLLMIDRVRGVLPAAPAHPPESLALLLGGMTCTYLVFNQANYPLVFLIQPITLLHAFRIGSLGSALHVGGVALVAGVMTLAGVGPIAESSGGGIAQLHLLQAFIAANFLTGLPVAAILAGRDRIMAELEAGKQQVDLLADNITDAVLRYDLNGLCTYASPSVREVMGLAPEILVGTPAGPLLHPDTHDRTIQALERLLDGTSEKERVTYRRFLDNPDGLPVFLEADGAVQRDPLTGIPEGIVVAARDVTERVELELLLTRARGHAENAAQAKSDFLANMSHEIRTPMNGVLGFAELMLQGELDHDQRRFAEMIVQSGRSMMMLLNDVLDLSKIESGQFAIDLAPVDLHASLAECAALHRPAAAQKGLMLDFRRTGSEEGDAPLDADQQPWVMTDGLRLRQIMLNLIGNAVKFTEAGHITVTYTVTPDEVQIIVADSGIGINAARLETIFHPFTQGEADTARRFGGTGLGLSISRQLASLLGGRITVESAPDAGSRFTLILPADLVEPIVDDPFEAPEAPEALPCASRILLVEDHDINRMLVTEMLNRCGQDVEVAHDGNEGIAMVIDSIMRGRPYDLVLMDVQMPDCDGYAATRAIRAEGIGPGLLPIIALTANAYPEDIAAARAAGMQGHLAKPIVLAQLARALQRWLPTRIIESEPERRPKRLSAMALSPGLLERWHLRRSEALEAVREALAQDALANSGAAPAELGQLVHKLAGSAAMFGEPELGEAAAALDRALARDASPARRTALAQTLLTIGDASAASPDQPNSRASARG
ncbi:MAG: ATP-binding protein [Erythrobacter sp.]|nr:ATP-binding protein [Erythrobacter sp.]